MAVITPFLSARLATYLSEIMDREENFKVIQWLDPGSTSFGCGKSVAHTPCLG